jgi:acyl carrier protein
MNRQHILHQLNAILEEITDRGPVHLSEATVPADVDGWDSLAHIQLIVAMERHFDIKFASEEMVSWENIGEILDSISAQCVPCDELQSDGVRSVTK